MKVEGVRGLEIVARRGHELDAPHEEGFVRAPVGRGAIDPVGRHGVAHGEFGRAGHEEVGLDRGEFPRDRVLPEEVHGVLARDEGEEILVAEQLRADLRDLVAGQVDRRLPVELVDRSAQGVGDLAVDLDLGVESVARTLREGELLGLDEVMDESQARGVAEDAEERVAVDVVGGVVDLDDAFIFQEFLGVFVPDLDPGRGWDLAPDEDLVGHRGRDADRALARLDGLPVLADHAQGDLRDAAPDRA